MVDIKGADYWIGLVAYGKKSLEEIFYEMLLTQETIYHSASTNIIFKENPDQNALEYLAFGKNFNGDRLTARNLNENLENNLQLEFFPCFPCVPWIIIIGI